MKDAQATLGGLLNLPPKPSDPHKSFLEMQRSLLAQEVCKNWRAEIFREFFRVIAQIQQITPLGTVFFLNVLEALDQKSRMVLGAQPTEDADFIREYLELWTSQPASLLNRRSSLRKFPLHSVLWLLKSVFRNAQLDLPMLMADTAKLHADHLNTQIYQAQAEDNALRSQ